jgi:cell division septation protein DedD
MTVSHRRIVQINRLRGLVLSVLLVCTGLWAQDTDSVISGTITDGEGSPVGGAQIMVRHLETGRTWSLLTGSEGVYIAPSLPPGSYVVEASAARFKTALTGVHLKNPREVVLDLVLQMGENVTGDKTSNSSQEPRQRERDSPPSRVTREDVSRPSGNHRLPPAAEFPPVDRRTEVSPPSEPAGKGQEQPEAESPPVDQRSSSSPSPEAPGTEQALPLTVQPAGFAVQVAFFRKREEAEGLRVTLQDRGYTSYVAAADIPGSGLYYRVRVGPFGTQEDAAEVVEDMRNRLPRPLPDFWIIPADR